MKTDDIIFIIIVSMAMAVNIINLVNVIREQRRFNAWMKEQEKKFKDFEKKEK